jgi:hypothetical protein
MDSKPQKSQLPAHGETSHDSREATLVFNETQTLAEMFKRHYRKTSVSVLAMLPPDHRKSFERDFFRHFDPWPDWVLRIAAEVCHVHLPTISKEAIEDALRFVHFFVFVARLDGSSKEQMPKMPDLSPKMMGALGGHTLAIALKLREKFEAARSTVPADKLEEISKEVSLENFQSEIAPAVAEYFKAKPSAFIGFQEGFSEAKSKTFDKHGSRKETLLTPIYERILSEWPEIECLTGPKALTEYLSPLLCGQDFEAKYERVKAICKRKRITFKPFVKGQ